MKLSKKAIIGAAALAAFVAAGCSMGQSPARTGVDMHASANSCGASCKGKSSCKGSSDLSGK